MLVWDSDSKTFGCWPSSSSCHVARITTRQRQHWRLLRRWRPKTMEPHWVHHRQRIPHPIRSDANTARHRSRSAGRSYFGRTSLEPQRFRPADYTARCAGCGDYGAGIRLDRWPHWPAWSRLRHRRQSRDRSRSQRDLKGAVECCSAQRGGYLRDEINGYLV